MVLPVSVVVSSVTGFTLIKLSLALTNSRLLSVANVSASAFPDCSSSAVSPSTVAVFEEEPFPFSV